MNKKNDGETIARFEKLCPLRSLFSELGHCLEDSCAFWDEKNNRCSIVLTNEMFETIKELVKNINILLEEMKEVLDNLNETLENLVEEENYYV